MNPIWMFLVLLIPCIGGGMLPAIRFKKRTHMLVFIEAIVVINSVLVFWLLFHRPEEVFTLVHITGNLTLTFCLDGLGSVFAGLVAFLWPLATLYAFEYMKKEHNEKIFFMFYTITYGVTLGIAFADNILTMYCFYEMLTLITVPLVMHTMTREAILASRKYLYYSLGGAAFAFIGLIFIIFFGDTTEFVLGGVLNQIKGQENLLLFVYVLTFFGFGVKAAVCPFNGWLPQAGVAPTPVTALLHAVAVVKSGAFAIMRMTYYSFGVGLLRGSWAQKVVMAAVIVTILYGCSMAVKETHLKRRLAFSTISNLSYILLGVVNMTTLGLAAALSHMVFHAFMKISAFFCAGAIMHQTNRHYVHQLDGLAKRMPKVFGIFTISALALMGVPGLSGFISKWNLASAAIESGNRMALFGVLALLISALLTAIYMLTIVVRGYFPARDFEEGEIVDVKDPNLFMLLPLFIFAVVIVIFGLFSAPFMELFTEVAEGLF